MSLRDILITHSLQWWEDGVEVEVGQGRREVVGDRKGQDGISPFLLNGINLSMFAFLYILWEVAVCHCCIKTAVRFDFVFCEIIGKSSLSCEEKEAGNVSEWAQAVYKCALFRLWCIECGSLGTWIVTDASRALWAAAVATLISALWRLFAECRGQVCFWFRWFLFSHG